MPLCRFAAIDALVVTYDAAAFSPCYAAAMILRYATLAIRFFVVDHRRRPYWPLRRRYAAMIIHRI